MTMMSRANAYRELAKRLHEKAQIVESIELVEGNETT
jgi:DICT domain-containing protein